MEERTLINGAVETAGLLLMHAIHKNQKDAVLALLDGGADVNAQNPKGLTALIMAAGYGYAEIVRQLLAGGADPHLETRSGVTAQAAAVSGTTDIDRFTLGDCQIETVRVLREYAPCLKLKSNLSGRFARWVARVGGGSEVLSLIEPPRGNRTSYQLERINANPSLRSSVGHPSGRTAVRPSQKSCHTGAYRRRPGCCRLEAGIVLRSFLLGSPLCADHTILATRSVRSSC